MDFHETPSAGPCAERATAMQGLIPELRTTRLVLRAPCIEDFQDFARIVLSPQGATYGAPKTRQDAWDLFMQVTGTWFLRGHGTWVITLDGETIGFVQLGAEPGDMEPELGYILDVAFEKQGFGSEAAAAIRDVGLGDFALPSLVSYVDVSNTRSVALATRIGGVLDQTADWEHADTHRYRYSNKEARL